MKKFIAIFPILLLLSSVSILGQNSNTGKFNHNLIAYYSGDSAALFKYDYSRITHVIYGFGHVNSEGTFGVNREKDLRVLRELIKLKQKYPHLKTLVALGGWGGCDLCSNVFNDPIKTKKFVRSVKYFLNAHQLDGFDFDWEYPVVKGYPGHQYLPEDKENFTNVVIKLRKALGKKKIISFAAGGFINYLEKSIEWTKIEPYLDFVNLMSYDLVGGYATVTGHQTPLYSGIPEAESADKAIQYLEKINFPLKKVIIGGTFYSRSWENVSSENNGLYQSGKFLHFIDYNKSHERFTPENGYQYFWDEKAQAAHWYSEKEKIFVTGDDKKSFKAKSDYVKKKGLGGLMFWELPLDLTENGLFDAIDINK